MNVIFFLLLFHLTILVSCSTREGDVHERPLAEESSPCPSNYILIPPHLEVGTQLHFCAMKYEARNVGGIPTSQSDGIPWDNITALDALMMCQQLGEKYDLMSNAEWMTIAREIELTSSNWSNSKLNRGWSAWQALDGFQNTIPAPSSNRNCLYNSGKNQCSARGLHSFKRTHQLSTGQEIWDFVGNVWEWVDWDVEAKNQGQFTLAPKNCPQGWMEISDMIKACSSQVPNLGNLIDERSKLVSPYNTDLSSKNFIGKINGGSGGAAMRGGHWKSSSFGGPYSLILHDPPNLGVNGVGFRCVYRL